MNPWPGAGHATAGVATIRARFLPEPVMELNPLLARIKDLQERATLARGYL